MKLAYYLPTLLLSLALAAAPAEEKEKKAGPYEQRLTEVLSKLSYYGTEKVPEKKFSLTLERMFILATPREGVSEEKAKELKSKATREDKSAFVLGQLNQFLKANEYKVAKQAFDQGFQKEWTLPRD